MFNESFSFQGMLDIRGPRGIECVKYIKYTCIGEIKDYQL